MEMTNPKSNSLELLLANYSNHVIQINRNKLSSSKQMKWNFPEFYDFKKLYIIVIGINLKRKYWT
eukprot:UN09935